MIITNDRRMNGLTGGKKPELQLYRFGVAAYRGKSIIFLVYPSRVSRNLMLSRQIFFFFWYHSCFLRVFTFHHNILPRILNCFSLVFDLTFIYFILSWAFAGMFFVSIVFIPLPTPSVPFTFFYIRCPSTIVSLGPLHSSCYCR